MPDINKVIQNPDTDSPDRADRELDLEGWNEEQGKRNAEQEGLDLTPGHWDVIYGLREYYLHHGPPENGREIGDMLDNKFASQGGRKYLYRLFPEGPVAQGMRIAGLRLPPHTADAGFGSSR